MRWETLEISRRDPGIVLVTLNRPKCLNAFSNQLSGGKLRDFSECFWIWIRASPLSRSTLPSGVLYSQEAWSLLILALDWTV